MEQDTASQIRDVKRLLRAAMSGPVSASMRAQGLGYKLNFGVDQPRLLTIADEVRETILAPAASEASVSGSTATDVATTDVVAAATLARALWKEDIRECRLLACMLMPTEACDEELADVWIEQARYAEEAQGLSMYLLERLPFAADLAFRLVSRERVLDRLTGWLLFGRLFVQGRTLLQRDADELLDHVVTELHDTTSDLQLRQTVLNALNRFMALGDAEAARGERILDEVWGES